VIEPLAGHGLMYRPATGPATDDPGDLVAYGRQALADAAAAAEEWLLTSGMSPWDLAVLDLLAAGRIAWWRDDAGFVQAEHDGAELVVVVAVPVRDPLSGGQEAAVETPTEAPAVEGVRQART